MKKLLPLIVTLLGTNAFATDVVTDSNAELLNQAEEVYNATRIVCSGISDQIAKVANISTANTAITGAGTIAASGALVAGVKKSNIDAEIETRLDEFCKQNNNCTQNPETNAQDFYTTIIEGLAEISTESGLDKTDSKSIESMLEQSQKLGNWRTGLMAGTIGTNLATAILSGRNMNQSDLIQQITACNDMIKTVSEVQHTLKTAGINPIENPVMRKLDNAKTWCDQMNVADVEKIENRMKASLGTSIAGGVIGVAGTATSAAANSDKYSDVAARASLHASNNNNNNNNTAESQKAKNLNTAANIMSGASIATGVAGTAVNISLISLAKKMIKSAQRCEETLQ